MPTNHRATRCCKITVEAIDEGTIELTVSRNKAQQLGAALQPLAVRLLLKQFGIRRIEQESSQYKVSGQVIMEDGKPVADIIIRAFNQNLRSEDFLGETVTSSAGRYEILYLLEQFDLAEKGSADLVVRAFNQVGTLLAESNIHFNAPPEATINLTISKSVPIAPSEYELLNAILTPLLDGVNLSDITEKDIWFLSNQTNIEEISVFPAGAQSIAFMVVSARFFKETGLHAEVFYGLARVHFTYDGAEIPDLKDLLAEKPEWWGKGVGEACAANIIPAWVCERMDEILKTVERLLSEQERRDPSYSKLRPGQTISKGVDIPETPEIGATPISEVIASLDLENQRALQELLAYLEKKGISTLADIRRMRGLKNVEDLPLTSDHPAVQTLEAHARLDVLPTRVTENRKLIEAGYSSAIQIADTSPEDFARSVSGEFDAIEAEKIHAVSVALARVLSHSHGLRGKTALIGHCSLSIIIKIPHCLSS